MTGKDDEELLFAANVNIRGNVHNTPLAKKGGCIVAQTKSFCASVGLETNSLCLNPVHDHLKEIATQYHFSLDM